jgi:hypothetical protein
MPLRLYTQASCLLEQTNSDGDFFDRSFTLCSYRVLTLNLSFAITLIPKVSLTFLLCYPPDCPQEDLTELHPRFMLLSKSLSWLIPRPEYNTGMSTSTYCTLTPYTQVSIPLHLHQRQLHNLRICNPRTSYASHFQSSKAVVRYRILDFLAFIRRVYSPIVGCLLYVVLAGNGGPLLDNGL